MIINSKPRFDAKNNFAMISPFFSLEIKHLNIVACKHIDTKIYVVDIICADLTDLFIKLANITQLDDSAFKLLSELNRGS